MEREEQIKQAAYEYINSDAVRPENMQLAFGDFINGAELADQNPTSPWKDARKERPQEGQAVLVASLNLSRHTEIICNLCQYEDGRFWNILSYRGIEQETNVVLIDCKLRYEVQDVKAWRDAKELFQEAGKFFIDPNPSEEIQQ